mgnify:CR=1 FL=1
MRCPNCQEQDTKVIDSRLLQDGDTVIVAKELKVKIYSENEWYKLLNI